MDLLADSHHNQTEHCPVCPELQTVQGLSFHLREAHSWATCPHCEELRPTELLEQHVEEHRPRVCTVCQGVYLEVDMSPDLHDGHSFRQCPFCATLEPEDVLRRHIQECHFPTEEESPGLPTVEVETTEVGTNDLLLNPPQTEDAFTRAASSSVPGLTSQATSV